jgi:hypothetical protein
MKKKERSTREKDEEDNTPKLARNNKTRIIPSPMRRRQAGSLSSNIQKALESCPTPKIE